MRLGLLGPAHGDLDALERGANVLLRREAADRVIYLGADDALDRVVNDWARRLVGDDPTDEGLWARAAVRCARADFVDVDRFVAAERARERLKALECLPASARTVEIFDGRLAVILHDKALLDEEDILPAAILIFGKSAEPLVRRVGPRTFIAPGSLADRDGAGKSSSGGVASRAGVALLADEPAGSITLTLFSAAGERLREEVIVAPLASRLRVAGQHARSGDPT